MMQHLSCQDRKVMVSSVVRREICCWVSYNIYLKYYTVFFVKLRNETTQKQLVADQKVNLLAFSKWNLLTYKCPH